MSNVRCGADFSKFPLGKFHFRLYSTTSQDDFTKSVRRHIANARLQLLGTALSATGSMSLLAGVDRYFPDVKEARYIFVSACLLLGVSLQFWTAYQSTKVGSASEIREWSKSLSQVRRSLTLMTNSFVYATVLLFILMGLSIDDIRHIDYAWHHATPVAKTAQPGCGADEAVKATGLGRTFLYERIARGELKSIKIGGRRLILHTDLVEFLTNCGAEVEVDGVGASRS